MKLKKVKYEVDGMGDLEDGTIIDAYLIVKEGYGADEALIYHPKDKHGCASVDLCVYERRRKVYVPFQQNVFINLGKADPFKALLPKSKKKK
jgi:hypothetical protein